MASPGVRRGRGTLLVLDWLRAEGGSAVSLLAKAFGGGNAPPDGIAERDGSGGRRRLNQKCRVRAALSDLESARLPNAAGNGDGRGRRAGP